MTQSDFVIAILITIILILIGIQLLRGKWLMLIAGYNTMPTDKRKRVQGKNLGKLVGCLSLWTALMIFLRLFLIPFDLPMVIGILIPLVFTLILANTSNKFKV